MDRIDRCLKIVPNANASVGNNNKTIMFIFLKLEDTNTINVQVYAP
jgi:hypothetical protein